MALFFTSLPIVRSPVAGFPRRRIGLRRTNPAGRTVYVNQFHYVKFGAPGRNFTARPASGTALSKPSVLNNFLHGGNPAAFPPTHPSFKSCRANKFLDTMKASKNLYLCARQDLNLQPRGSKPRTLSS